MKVADLLEHLQICNPEAEVVADFGDEIADVGEIEGVPGRIHLRLRPRRGTCPSCECEGLVGTGCQTCPGFWFTNELFDEGE